MLIASVATCLVLMTSLGGTTWGWSSWQIIGLGVLGLVLLVAFVQVERTAEEPVLPLRLFRSRTFSLVAVISFVVGFAMFGALTYLPTFLQVVMKVSPTMSGIHMLPMVIGMLVTSIGSGQIVARTGHYRAFPIMRHRDHDRRPAAALPARREQQHLRDELLLPGLRSRPRPGDAGAGADRAELRRLPGPRRRHHAAPPSSAPSAPPSGSPSSARSSPPGSTTGSATPWPAVPLPPGFGPGAITSDPRVVEQLPAATQAAVYHAYAESITRVFLYAVPVAVVAFVLSLFLREQKLRTTVTAPDLSESIGLNPVERSSLDEISRALSVLGTREARRDLFKRITATAGLDLKPASSWLLLQIYHHGSVEPAELAERRIVPFSVVEEAVREVEGRGLAARSGGLPLRLTEPGEAAAVQLVAARRAQLAELLGDWDEKQFDDLAALLTRLASTLCADERDRPDRVVDEPPYRGEGRSF